MPASFRPPGIVEGADPTARRALFVASTDSFLVGGGQCGWFDPAGCDLTALNEGRAPLLLDHSRSVRDVVGVIEAGWREGSSIRVVARFGLGADANLAWENVAAGVWGACSLGNTVTDTERRGERGIVIRRWRATELSLVPIGWVPDAAVLPTYDLAELLRISEERRAEAAANALKDAARLKALGLAAERLRLHALAAVIARDLGLAVDRVVLAMDRHLAAIEGGG